MRKPLSIIFRDVMFARLFNMFTLIPWILNVAKHTCACVCVKCDNGDNRYHCNVRVSVLGTYRNDRLSMDVYAYIYVIYVSIWLPICGIYEIKFINLHNWEELYQFTVPQQRHIYFGIIRSTRSIHLLTSTILDPFKIIDIYRKRLYLYIIFIHFFQIWAAISLANYCHISQGPMR